MLDVKDAKISGKTCRTQNHKPIFWKGHLCEGANIVAPIGEEFCLWTLCGDHDVPANAAREGDVRDVRCSECIRVWNEESGVI